MPAKLKSLNNIIKAPLIAWVILLLSLLATYFIWSSINKVVNENAKHQFELHSINLQEAIKNRLIIYEQVLNSAKGLFKASDNVSREEWRIFVENIKVEKHFPGIQGIGYAEVIPPNNLNEFIQAVRKEGFPDFRVHPEGEREIYTSIKFLEPFDWRNQRAFGYDMFSESNRRAAMEYARDSNLPSISKKITLLQENPENPEDVQAGFLLYLPLYEKGRSINSPVERKHALKGYVYSPFRMSDLMDAILLHENKQADLCVYDGEYISEDTLMYCSNVLTGKGVFKQADYSASKFHQNVDMSFGGNTWMFAIHSTPVFDDSVDKSPIIIAIAGVLVSFLLFTIASIVRGRILKEISSVLHKHELILESAGEGVYGIDTKGNCTFINKSALKMLQMEPEEIQGKNVHQLIHHSKPDGSAFPDEECPIYAAFKYKKVNQIDNEVFWRKDGQPIPVEYTSTPMLDIEDRVIGAVISFRDISQRLETESELAKQTEELKRSNEELSQFAYVASHDLQEPLRKIQAFGDRLVDKELNNLSENGKNYLDRMQNAAARMRSLINDLLSYSRVSTQGNDFECIALDEIVHSVIDDLETRISDTKAVVEFDKLPNVFADSLQMRQLFQNLIGNALKFNKPDTTPVIKIYTKHEDTKSAKDFCSIVIEDNGIGFEDEFKYKIFMPFQRLHGREVYEGTGMGLAICQKIIERHNGEMQADSVLGQGTKFTVVLPLCSP